LTRRIDHLAATLAATLCLMQTIAAPSRLTAQRRPGVNMGFYTTTDLRTTDVEGGTIISSTPSVRAPRLALSLLVTAPVKRLNKKAWIVGVRATPLVLGNTVPCVRTAGEGRCLNGRFSERLGLLGGGAFDIRSTILRAMVGPSLYHVEGKGARLGPTLRVDFATPRLHGPTPTLFFTRTYVRSERGEAAGLSSLGAGFRWVRKK
jgi:hypothetical protein